MGRIAGWVLLAVLVACSWGELVPEIWPIRLPGYPTTPQFDYAPTHGLAHAALPIVDDDGHFAGRGRIWLKGSPTVGSARVDGGAEVELLPPHFVAMVDADPGPANVEFFGSDGGRRVAVIVPSAAELNAPRARFSFLSYGCFEPFSVHDGRAIVNPGDGTSEPGAKPGRWSQLLAIRQLLREAAAGNVPDLPRPSLICGAGDQVYVESAHDSYPDYGTAHPLSAWTVEPKPRPRISLPAFVDFLDETYRRHWSFATLDEVFRACPAVMIWDDHEIRDGWGSHGDEHIFLDTYYAAARQAVAQHEFLRGPRAWHDGLAAPRAPLYQTLSLHRLPMFVLDERSARDVTVPQVLGEEQGAKLREWLDALDPAQTPYYVIVSPLPLLFRVADIADLGADFDAEVLDDLLDLWSSDVNRRELDELMAAMLQTAERGLRAIVVSGDIHISAILRATARRSTGAEKASVFAYEIITSGLAGVLSGGWKHRLGHKGAILPEPVAIGPYSIDTALGIAEARPNFGGIEIDDGRVVAHLFQALPAGCRHYRIPLDWGPDAPDFDEAIAKGRRDLPRPR